MHNRSDSVNLFIVRDRGRGSEEDTGRKTTAEDEGRMLDTEGAIYDILDVILEQIYVTISVQRKRLIIGVQALRSLRSALTCSCRTICVRCMFLIAVHEAPL